MNIVYQFALSATLCTLLLTGSILHPHTATAATYYVATDGNDANQGTEERPFQTIRKGISVVKAGDTLYIKGGTYAEAIYSYNFSPFPTGTSWDNPVTIASYPDETAVLAPDGGGTVIDMADAHYVIFDRLVLDAGNTIYAMAVGSQGAHHIRFQNGEIKNAGGYENVELSGSFNEVIDSKIHDSQHSYGFYITGHDNLVDGNDIYNNAGYAVQIYDGSNSSDNHTVSNNKMWGNGFSRQEAAVTVNAGKDNFIYNNLIYDNWAGIDVLWRSPVSTRIDSNTIHNNRYGILIGSESQGAIIQNNILYQNAIAIEDHGIRTILRDNS